MKFAAALLAAFVALAAADTEPSLVGMGADGTVATNTSSSNATTAGDGVNMDRVWMCFPPNLANDRFYRLTKRDGPHYCQSPPLPKEWAMLRSYRDGGIEGVHWKYTDNPNDNECMKDWIYHAADGRTVKTRVSGRTTTYGLNRRWCGLPVYHDGGVEGYQWAYCMCRWEHFGGGSEPIPRV